MGIMAFVVVEDTAPTCKLFFPDLITSTWFITYICSQHITTNVLLIPFAAKEICSIKTK